MRKRPLDASLVPDPHVTRTHLELLLLPALALDNTPNQGIRRCRSINYALVCHIWCKICISLLTKRGLLPPNIPSARFLQLPTPLSHVVYDAHHATCHHRYAKTRGEKRSKSLTKISSTPSTHPMATGLLIRPSPCLVTWSTVQYLRVLLAAESFIPTGGSTST